MSYISNRVSWSWSPKLVVVRLHTCKFQCCGRNAPYRAVKVDLRFTGICITRTQQRCPRAASRMPHTHERTRVFHYTWLILLLVTFPRGCSRGSEQLLSALSLHCCCCCCPCWVGTFPFFYTAGGRPGRIRRAHTHIKALTRHGVPPAIIIISIWPAIVRRKCWSF